jgi:hypothetical protein
MRQVGYLTSYLEPACQGAKKLDLLDGLAKKCA